MNKARTAERARQRKIRDACSLALDCLRDAEKASMQSDVFAPMIRRSIQEMAHILDVIRAGQISPQPPRTRARRRRP